MIVTHNCVWCSFAHRGLLIDTGRHFLPVSRICRMVEAMAVVKLNVLHWHLYDFQSFPVESTALPFLWNGSFSATERYTRTDVRHVVSFAKSHGVRVMAELDMPGHASSWCHGYPDLCPSPACNQPLNIAHPDTFRAVSSLLAEYVGQGPSPAIVDARARRAVAGVQSSKKLRHTHVVGGPTSTEGAAGPLFDDTHVHIGGDEIETECWEVSTKVVEWLRARRLSPKQGITHFIARVREILRANQRIPVVWEEVFHGHREAIDHDCVIQVWKRKETLKEVVGAGFKAILSNSLSQGASHWYLDDLKTTPKEMHANEPCDNLNPDECALVLGGEACMWGETVDASNIMTTVWYGACYVHVHNYAYRHCRC